ncbi:MAG: copper chaperone CopZ [Bacteroidia bacterium]
MSTEKLNIKITGMTCGHCEKFVKSVITELNGVKSAEVSYSNGDAHVVIDNALIHAEQIVAAINDTVVYHVTEVKQE